MSEIAIEIGIAVAPDGDPHVLLQLPNGYVLLKPDDARYIAETITLTAEKIDHGHTS